MSRTFAVVFATILAVFNSAANADSSDDAKAAQDAAKKAEQSAQDAKQAAEDAKSGDNLKGDKITLSTTTPGFVLLRDPDGANDKVGLAGTKLRVIRDEAGVLYVAVEDVPCVVRKSGATFTVQANYLTGVGSDIKCENLEAKDKVLQKDEAYKISKSKVVEFGFKSAGWVYGALLVPYKYHRHDRSFSSAATIGPYLGYKLTGFGIDAALIGSLGISSLAVPNGSGSTTTQQGYTAAIGIIASVTKSKSPLRVGLLIGKDWAGSNSATPYAHEGKTWIAAQIGFSFSD
jgi:hypothetical protein